MKMHLNLKAPCIYLLSWGVRMKNECAHEDDVHATTSPNHHLDLLFILHVGTHQVQEGFSADEDADDAASQQKTLATEKGALKVREKKRTCSARDVPLSLSCL